MSDRGFAEPDEDKNTKLHFAAAYDDIEDVIKILQSGHKVDPENVMGWTPLMMAARNGNIETIKILLEHKADATRKNLYGSTVFLMSVASGLIDAVHLILQHLLRGGVSRSSLEAILSPFALALLFEQEPLVQYLATSGFSLNFAAPITGLTPIMYAAAKDNDCMYQLMATKDGNPYTKNINNQSAQDMMFYSHHKELPQRSAQPNYLQITPSNYPHTHTPHHHHHHHHPTHASPYHNHTPQYQKTIPVLYISPQPSYINSPVSNQEPSSKSSNVGSPCFMFPPSISPITPHLGYMPQVFFPQDFNPNGVISPSGNFMYPENSMLNQNVFFSPMSPHVIACPHMFKMEDQQSAQ